MKYHCHTCQEWSNKRPRKIKYVNKCVKAGDVFPSGQCRKCESPVFSEEIYLKPEMRFSTNELIILLEIAQITFGEEHMLDEFIDYLGLSKEKLKPLQNRLLIYNSQQSTQETIN